jgi:U2-associated protein SR140
MTNFHLVSTKPFKSRSRSRSSSSDRRPLSRERPSRSRRSQSPSWRRSESPQPRSRRYSRSRSPYSRRHGHSPRRTPEEEEVTDTFIRAVAAEVKGHGAEYEDKLSERERQNPKYSFLRRNVSSRRTCNRSTLVSNTFIPAPGEFVLP